MQNRLTSIRNVCLFREPRLTTIVQWPSTTVLKATFSI